MRIDTLRLACAIKPKPIKLQKNEEKKINKPCSKNTKNNLKSAERTVKSVVTQNDAEFGH